MGHSEPRSLGRRPDDEAAAVRVEPADPDEGADDEPGWRSRSIASPTPQLDVPHRRYPPSGPGVAPDVSPGGREGDQDSTFESPSRATPGRRESQWFREPLTVAELMTREVKTVAPETPLSAIAVLMRDEDVGVVPVVDETRALQGIVTDRDMVVRGLVGGSGEREPCARDLATKGVEAVSPRDSITSVLDLMGRKQIRRAPVVGENGRLIGMISLADVAARADYDKELQDALRQISGRRSFWSRIWR